MVFLAVADVSRSDDWKLARGYDSQRSLRTRDIIEYLNRHFGENLSRGSYDDIRTEELKPLVLGGLVTRSAGNPDSSRNDPRRGYALPEEVVEVLRAFGTKTWRSGVDRFLAHTTTLAAELSDVRHTSMIPIRLPSGFILNFSPGQHNQLQKALIEEFLPRYGYGAEVLYVGDTANKFLFRADERLRELDFFELGHGELPDIVAYSAKKRWLYLVEAVHSSGPVSPIRHLELERLTRRCRAGIVFVTGFLTKTKFRTFAADIAWETEVWIAESPDHLIHFNGDAFIGPHPIRT